MRGREMNNAMATGKLARTTAAKARFAVLTGAVLMGTGAMLGLAGCGFLPASPDAKKALAAMALDKSGAGIVTYEKLTTSGSRAEITDAKITIAEGLEIPVGKIVFKGLDMTAGATPGPSFESMELLDVAYSLSGVPGVSAKLNIKRVYLLDPGPEAAKWATSLFLKDNKAVFPDLATIDYKDSRIEGAEGSFKSTQEDASGTFRLASVISGQFRDLTGSKSSMNGLVIELDTKETGRMTVNLGEVVTEKPTLKLAKLIFDDVFGVNATPGSSLAQNLVGLTTVNHKVVAEFGPLEQGFDRATIRNFSFSGLGIKAEWPSLVTTATRDKDGFATGVRTETAPLVISPVETGRYSATFKEFLDSLGYTNLTLNYNGSLTYDRTADRAAAEKIELGLANGAAFTFGGSVKGVIAGAKAAAALSSEIAPDASPSAPALDDGASPDETLPPVPGAPDISAVTSRSVEAQRVFLEKLALEAFDMTVADTSLIDRIVQYLAKTGGTPAADIRRQWLAGLAALKAGPEDPAATAKLATELRGALESFLNAAFERKPAKLLIAMKPVQPLPLGELQSGAFAAKPENLGLKFSSDLSAGKTAAGK